MAIPRVDSKAIFINNVDVIEQIYSSKFTFGSYPQAPLKRKNSHELCKYDYFIPSIIKFLIKILLSNIKLSLRPWIENFINNSQYKTLRLYKD